MKEIKLTRGYVAFVDDEDFERVNKYKWRSLIDKHNVYALADVEGLRVRMHRFILNAKSGTVFDHKDCNSLNNQKSNLRTCTIGENNANSRKHRVTGSKYKGVCKHKQWSAYVTQNGKTKCLGHFDDEVDAAIAYNNAAIEVFGEFARINVIE